MYQEYTKFIDKFGARPAGTANLENAIDYMVNLTKQNDLDDVTTEELEVPHWERLHESARMLQPQSKNIAILGLGTSISTPPEGITAEVIVINNFEELEKTNQKDIVGKIVVFDAHFISYGKTVIYRTQGASKAAKKGAVATLIRSITPFSIYTPHTGAQSYDKNVTKIPTAAITLEDADLMRRLQDERNKIVVTIKMCSKLDKKTSRNILIDLKGSRSPEKTVIVSGHIDSWDVGQGAMDDGGGMFISWFIPVILNQRHLKPRRTVRAILWTGEENGLIGAQAYLKKHDKELSNINFIMESDEGTFKPLGLDVSASKEGRCIIQEILNLFKPINKMENSGHPGSDIAIFTRKGIPGASLVTQEGKYYWFHHSEGDTLNVQNMTDVIDCAAFWAAFTYVIADLSVDIPRN
ncbi:unnamed protein product [Arctia plantaginis]|uniref:Carboxypeptidase Q n=1 Tax=Arctia plantaginis TaxID=874455 RepID=A0A8S1BEL8_ARCPL|nr:unnamed protein product [Arctia plantaginis]